VKITDKKILIPLTVLVSAVMAITLLLVIQKSLKGKQPQIIFDHVEYLTTNNYDVYDITNFNDFRIFVVFEYSPYDRDSYAGGIIQPNAKQEMWLPYKASFRLLDWYKL